LPERKAADTHGLKVGMDVFHAKFGQGCIKMIEGAGADARAHEGAGADARAQVDFSRHGVKWLALSVAKLTVVQ
jgi:DNA helicase-2/ATP-dependent DNA helicase PcrA